MRLRPRISEAQTALVLVEPEAYRDARIRLGVRKRDPACAIHVSAKSTAPVAQRRSHLTLLRLDLPTLARREEQPAVTLGFPPVSAQPSAMHVRKPRQIQALQGDRNEPRQVFDRGDWVADQALFHQGL